MNLVIHDYDKQEWEKISDRFQGWEVISDDGSIKPCVGCFGCWVKTPGECVIKDGYGRMGEKIHRADEVVVLSRFTYGGFSSFIKNVFDRSIGWVLPFFELYEGEMHHKQRYPETKDFTFVFRGKELSDEDKANAKQYVEAVCRNLHGNVKDVRFEECESAGIDVNAGASLDAVGVMNVGAMAVEDKTILLNCSLRGDNANSKKFLDKLSPELTGNVESLNLVAYTGRYEELVKALLPAKNIVLGMPLYVDGIPSAPLRIMEMLEKCQDRGTKNIYVLANMGFYESSQIKNLLAMVRTWCVKCGFTYGGGLACGAGEMMGMMLAAPDISKGPAHNIATGLKELSAAINTSSTTEDFYADAYKFPRFLYMLAANSSWPRGAKENGLKKKDLMRQL